MMRNRYTIILAALALCFGCEKEQFTPARDSSAEIVFSTSLKEMGSPVMTRSVDDHLVMELSEWDDPVCATKASPSTMLEGDASIYCYHYASTLNPATDALFEDKKYSFDGTQLIPETPYAWTNMDSGKTLRFFSYAPFDGGGDFDKITYTGGMTGLRYTVPAQASSQRDFLYASSSEITSADFRKPVALQYRHAMSAIQFRMGFKDVTVKSVSIKQVNGRGVFTFVHALSTDKWAESDLLTDYTIDFGAGVSITSEGQMLVDADNTLMLIPQEFAADSEAKIELVYTDTEGEHTISGSLKSSSWPMGKKIVYTLHKAAVQYEYVYFDLVSGSVEITPTTYSGYVTVGNAARQITGTKTANTRFYVYQSLYNGAGTNNYKQTGYASEADLGQPEKIRLPSYTAVSAAGTPWGDYITNNNDFADVVGQWSSSITATGREPITSGKNIYIHGVSDYDLTVDNLYSSCPGTAVIRFDADNGGKLTLRVKGDSRFDRIDYDHSNLQTSKFIITSADGDGATSGTLTLGSHNPADLASDNKPVIGPNGQQASYGLTFNGATVFAGSPSINNNVWGERSSFKFSTIVGGGINSLGEVTINGGRLTAVSNSTSAAIGGGGGYLSAAGPGIVTVNGGEVYAYANGIYGTANQYEGFVPTAAIGGGSTFMYTANHGSVITINGGYVYAESLGGTAIGGGNAMGNGINTGYGGNAVVNITGGTIVAKSVAGLVNNGNYSAQPKTAIGGGYSVRNDGGNATITITGGRLTTGSIGGGGTSAAGKYIGSADINISGSALITAQFVMANGSNIAPSFRMTGGVIYNNNTADSNCASVNLDGGAVYMEAGTCEISGGTIRNCSARRGGAIYLEGGQFTMTGGTITKNASLYDGGAVCVNGGDATVSGGEVSLNLAGNGNGGGICVSGGSFAMPDGGTGVIRYNAAHSDGASNTGNGGGVYVSSTEDVNANLISGSMTNNTSDRNGGGICIDGGSGTNVVNIAIGKMGGTPASPYIYDNSAAMSGGGMCVLGANSVVTIYSGTIHGEVSAFVKNEDVRIDGGTVSLVGGSANCDIKFNTVRFNSNNSKGDVLEQRIVTNTNSKLAPPAGTGSWTKEFHVLKEWNTKADGSGVTYSKEGGELMVISEDVDLYAIWTPSVSGS